MSFLSDTFDTNSGQNTYREKFYRVLEEKSLLEDEIISVANYARSYQAISKSLKEELESVKSSFTSICGQNSELEAEIINLNSVISLKNSEIEKLHIEIEEQSLVINNLKDLINKDSQTATIKELSFIILSKENHSPDSPLLKNKYSELIKEALEEKIKTMEKEKEEYHQKCKDFLHAYCNTLTENLIDFKFITQIGHNQHKLDEYINKRNHETEIKILQAEYAIENLEYDEKSFYTSMTESPKISEDIFAKTKTYNFPMQFIEIQASAIEDLILNK